MEKQILKDMSMMYNLGNAENKKQKPTNDWKTTVPDLFRKFATWFIVRKNKQFNQTKTSHYKIKNSLKNLDTCSPYQKTIWSEIANYSGYREKFLRNIVTGH